MLSYQEALQIVFKNQKDFGTEEVSLLQSVGRTLARNVFADRDFPPYNRVMMDGIAINFAAFNEGLRNYKIEKIQAAGSPQVVLENKENCIEVMTGSILPFNTDVVIAYEQCEIKERIATIQVNELRVMQNVHLQGTDSKKQDLLVEKWNKITPAAIGILASVGLSTVTVLKQPKITICSTGDELIDVTEQPQAQQVRRSNVYMLAAALISENIIANTIHLPDDSELMTSAIAALVKSNDVIMFSGAVSKGKFDYLPVVLEKLGMQQIFHTVAQRPGKPFLFGKFSNDALVFGFPGNPVSTFVCYQQFFKRWLHNCMQNKQQLQFVTLAEEIVFKPALSYHIIGQLINNNGKMLFHPLSGSTSGDQVTLLQADSIITLPPHKTYFNAEDVFEVNVLN